MGDLISKHVLSEHGTILCPVSVTYFYLSTRVPMKLRLSLTADSQTPSHGIWVWCGGRKDAADSQFLEGEDIGLIIAGVAFEYGATSTGFPFNLLGASLKAASWRRLSAR